MDSGKLEEYDKPHVLLHNKSSLFYKMAQHLGETEANALTEKAKQVSLLQRVVIKVHLQGSLLTLGVWYKHFVPFSIGSFQKLSFMTGS